MSPGTQFLIICLTLLLVTAISGQKEVQIGKCCVIDEYLGKDTNYTCTPGRNLSWTLKILNPRKHGLIKDIIPKYWHIQENRRPQCSNPRSFSAKSPSPYVVFSNGSLFLPEYSEKLYHPSEYCLDYGAVIVCTDEEAQNITHPSVRVKKCCLGDGAYSETKQSCITMNESLPLRHLDDFAVRGAGFPECRDGHAIVGKMNQSKLLQNGSLFMNQTQVLLPPGGFCLENVLEQPGESELGLLTGLQFFAVEKENGNALTGLRVGVLMFRRVLFAFCCDGVVIYLSCYHQVVLHLKSVLKIMILIFFNTNIQYTYKIPTSHYTIQNILLKRHLSV